jgi:hypothetical protein
MKKLYNAGDILTLLHSQLTVAYDTVLLLQHCLGEIEPIPIQDINDIYDHIEQATVLVNQIRP